VVANYADPQSYRAYSYARNNPLNFTDPTGMCPGCTPLDELTSCTNCTGVSAQNGSIETMTIQARAGTSSPDMSGLRPIDFVTTGDINWVYAEFANVLTLTGPPEPLLVTAQQSQSVNDVAGNLINHGGVEQRTNRSAYAFRFGLLLGSLTGCTPACSSVSLKARGKSGSRS